MNRIYLNFPILLCFIVCSTGYAQFDSTGFRFLCYYDRENTARTTKFTDTNFYLLRNSGKVKEGLLLEFYDLIHPGMDSVRFLFDPSLKQRSISQIEIEQFAYRNGTLAILSNQGIYMTESPDKPLKLASAELTAFEYDGLEFSDSILFVYRNSHKTYGPFMEVVSLNLKTGSITPYAAENDIHASIYSNFHDTRLIDFGGRTPIRADYVLPVIYRYGSKTDTLSLLADPLFAFSNQAHFMPEELIHYMSSYATEADLVYLDTTIKLNYSHYANRFISVSKDGEKMILLSSIPGQESIYKPRFILTEWSISETELKLENFIEVNSVKTGNSSIIHALEVINLWGTIHITQDEKAWYFIIRKATALSPAGKTATEYYKANYPLQFENTGFAVIRLEK